MSNYNRHLITAALPYANGPIHFGHMTGVYIPADIYARHLRNLNKNVKFVCGSDEHGVAIMLNAKKNNQSYQEYVNHWHKTHHDLFAKYDVHFDVFGQTSSDYHAEETVKWFKALHEKGLIEARQEKQLFCIDDDQFLPDRYVEGECYKCGFENARGDECPNCGEWIDAIRLKNPVSTVSGSRNIEIRETTNYFLLMTKLEKEFRDWFATKTHWRKLVTGMIGGLLEQGMVDRAISRDLDWGIDVPLPEAKGKKLYVWFDAPIGYVSNLKKHLEDIGSDEDYQKDWYQNKNCEISHFIGKDNIIFHALVFPCMAMGSGRMKLVDEVPANEFLNLAGRQFSKSAGWYVDADQAVAEFGATAMRFYLCSIIPETGDTNFTWDGFEKVYNDFGNKIGNFVHRAFSFMQKNWPEGLSAEACAAVDDAELKKIAEKTLAIIEHNSHCRFTRAHAELLLLGQTANEFFQSAAPWKAVKTDKAAAEKTIATAVMYTLAMAVLLEPFVPSAAATLLRYFESVSEEDRKKVYAGDTAHMKKIFANGFAYTGELTVLVPRLDADLLQKWKDELQQ